VRDHHTTFVVESGASAFLYVIGGTDNWTTTHDDVQRTRLHDDGTLDAFERVGTLPGRRAGHATAVVGKTVVVIGGSDGHSPKRETYVVRIGPDGALGPFVSGPLLPQGTMHLACVARAPWVYCTGGLSASTGKSSALSLRARVGDDGTLSAFETQAPLDPTRSHHMTWIHRNWLYVGGGLIGSPMDGGGEDRKDILRAPLDDDGNLGAWEPAGEFPQPLSVSAAQLFDDAVYFFGGYNGANSNHKYSAEILRGIFAADGTIDGFDTLPAKLRVARAHVHQTPTWGRFIYSVGGKIDSEDSIGAVEVGTFE
jgi:hypothetical protein